MGNIVLLDELTINKIAAGEVIERPASVVKELVENSIDAGADNITVEIQNGGIKRIKIIDNGCGISKDDMEFAFERHATSKIRQADDLENIKSMGFRGEALASIAAIANVKMISRTKDDENGNMIVVEGGNVLENEEIAAGIGTTITVSNLFYNTPVRYKFLKKDFTEAGYIEDVITRIALSYPNIAIKLINGNKTVIQTNGSGSIQDVIYTIYGKDVAQNLVNVSYTYEDVKVEGVIGKPQIARNNRSYQQFFVNNRYIKDKTLSSAADQAFRGLLTIGKYGFLVLNIEIEPNKIDVNVHPTKLEIRWSEEQKVFKAVYHTIREGLLKEDLISMPETNKSEETVEEPKVVIESEDEEEKAEKSIIENLEDRFKAQSAKTVSFMNFFKKKEEPQEEFIEHNTDNTIQDLYNIKKEIDALKENNRIEEPSVEPSEETLDKPIEKSTEEIFTPSVSESIEEKINTAVSQDTIVVRPEIEESQETLENKPETEISQDTIVIKPEIPGNEQDISEGNEDNNEATQEVVLPNENISEETQKIEISTDNEETENPKDGFKVPSEEQIDKITSIPNLQKNMQNEIEKRIDGSADFNSMYQKTFGKLPNDSIVKEEDNIPRPDLSKVKNISVFENDESYTLIPTYTFIGALFNTYIVIEIKDDIYIIDQHAAHERVMYEKVKKNFYSEGEKDSQIMLLPDIINLSHKEKSIVKENEALFRKAGFILEEFGENTIRLIGVPSMCMDLDTKELFLQILDEIDTVAITATQEKEEKFMSTVACKAAVKAKMKLNKEEVDDLMRQLLVLKNPFTCPHGRPTAIKMTKQELDKKFERT